MREEDEDLPVLLHQFHDEGMRDYTFSLCELVHQDRILRTTAMDYAPSPEALSSALKGIDCSGGTCRRQRKVTSLAHARDEWQRALLADLKRQIAEIQRRLPPASH